jgi:hypothetical protein
MDRVRIQKTVTRPATTPKSGATTSESSQVVSGGCSLRCSMAGPSAAGQAKGDIPIFLFADIRSGAVGKLKRKIGMSPF